MKYIKVLLSSLFVLVLFTACSQKEVTILEVVEVVDVQIEEAPLLHSKIIAVEKSK